MTRLLLLAALVMGGCEETTYSTNQGVSPHQERRTRHDYFVHTHIEIDGMPCVRLMQSLSCDWSKYKPQGEGDDG